MADPIRDFLVDANNDLAVVNGDFATVAGPAAVSQGISIRVQMFLTEVFLDESIGVDWLGQILVKNPNPVVIRELLREAIADSPDVTNVIGTQVQMLPNREAAISYQVASTYSSSPILGQVVVPGNGG